MKSVVLLHTLWMPSTQPTQPTTTLSILFYNRTNEVSWLFWTSERLPTTFYRQRSERGTESSARQIGKPTFRHWKATEIAVLINTMAKINEGIPKATLDCVIGHNPPPPDRGGRLSAVEANSRERWRNIAKRVEK